MACVKNTRVPYAGPSERSDAVPAIAPGPRLEVMEVAGRRSATREVLKLYRPHPCGTSHDPELGAIADRSRSPGPKRWIIVLPIWGSSTYPPRKVVTWLTHGPREADTNVLWVQDPGRFSLMDYPSMKAAPTEGEFLTAVARSSDCIGAAAEDVRGWMDWILRQPSADPRRVGIVGCSIGAIVGSLAMGRDRRFAAGAFVMGGGHLEEILASCYGEEAQVRQHAASAFGWSTEDFLREVAVPLAPADPVAVAGAIDPASVLFIDAGKDTCIPPSSRNDLWEAMGRPERVTLGYDHKTSFLSMTFLGFDRTTSRIVEFLDSKLTLPGTAAPPDRSATVQAQPQ